MSVPFLLLPSLPSPLQRGPEGGEEGRGRQARQAGTPPPVAAFPLRPPLGTRRARALGTGLRPPLPRREGTGASAVPPPRTAGLGPGAWACTGGWGRPAACPPGLAVPSAVGAWGQLRAGASGGSEAPGSERGSAAVKTRARRGGLRPCPAWSQAVAPV